MRIAPRGNDRAKTCTIDHPGAGTKTGSLDPSNTFLHASNHCHGIRGVRYRVRYRLSFSLSVNILRVRECIREKKRKEKGNKKERGKKRDVEISDGAFFFFSFFFLRRNRYNGDAGIVQFYKRCPPTRLSRAAWKGWTTNDTRRIPRREVKIIRKVVRRDRRPWKG